MTHSLLPIGFLRSQRGNFAVDIAPEFRQGLAGLEGFGHLLVIFGFHDSPAFTYPDLLCEQPYVAGPAELGVFASRSPVRPNPLGITVCSIRQIDATGGRIVLDYHDALEGTPVYDIKPYTPSLDRVAIPRTPAWASAWPASIEGSARFDWSTVFAN